MKRKEMNRQKAREREREREGRRRGGEGGKIVNLNSGKREIEEKEEDDEEDYRLAGCRASPTGGINIFTWAPKHVANERTKRPSLQ